MSRSDEKFQSGLLTVTRSDEGAQVRVSLVGELDLSNTESLDAALEEAIESGKKVLIDFGGLEFLDSTGLALIVKTLGRNDAERFSFLPSRFKGVRRLLALTGLDERMVLSTVGESASTAPVG
jgi:anti-sigma B factor antagonist